MAVGCMAKVSKVLLFAFNIIFFLAGAAVLGVGIWLAVDDTLVKLAAGTTFKDIIELLHTSAIILIVFGSIIFVVGFCGCCGAMRESKCLIGIYLTFIIIVIVGELAAGIYALVEFPALETAAKSLGSKEIQKYSEQRIPSEAENDKVWDFLMVEFQCCGWTSAGDFNSSSFRNQTGLFVPKACCDLGSNKYTYGDVPQPKDYGACQTAAKQREGCYQAFVDTISDNTVIIMAVAGGIAGLELVVFFAALCFCCGIGKDY